MDKKVVSLKWYNCGYCINVSRFIFKNAPFSLQRFYAGAVLIEHKKQGFIMYDTGYSEQVVHHKGIVPKLYSVLNPIKFNYEEGINRQLFRDGIKQIDKIILSHAHPDHTGGLKYLNCKNVITTKEVWKTIVNPCTCDLVFKDTIPNLNYTILRTSTENFLSRYFNRVYDVFGDGSVYGIDLPGHAKGQLGLYFPEHKVLLAADSCWSDKFIDKTQDMTFAARKVQNDFTEYCETVSRIQSFLNDYPDTKVYFSHQRVLDRKISKAWG